MDFCLPNEEDQRNHWRRLSKVRSKKRMQEGPGVSRVGAEGPGW
jgi:hypothetical protein